MGDRGDDGLWVGGCEVVAVAVSGVRVDVLEGSFEAFMAWLCLLCEFKTILAMLTQVDRLVKAA